MSDNTIGNRIKKLRTAKKMTLEDVARAVVALCDGTFSYTTGTSLIVDGGMHIRSL